MVSDSFKLAFTLIFSFNDHIHIELNDVNDGASVTLDQRVVTCHGTKRTIALNTADQLSEKGQWMETLSCGNDDQVVFKVEQFNIEENVDFLEMMDPNGDEIFRESMINEHFQR